MERNILRVLLVAEGSGGHLIPALEVAKQLAAAGASVRVWYAKRAHAARLVARLIQDSLDATVEVEPIPLEASAHPLLRLWQCGQLWSQADRCLGRFAPHIVVGFGGWMSAPVIAAAKRRRIACMLHEQNVVLGRANRLLVPWVDRIAVSFCETQATLQGAPTVMTGMPIRQRIGQAVRSAAARQFDFDVARPTLLVLGGSQGSHAINDLMARAVRHCSTQEQHAWQVLHITGALDESRVRRAYAACGLKAWVVPFMSEMEDAYALADVVVARAGASTIAELARTGTPAIFIPYPFAGGHQRANAQVVESNGGGVLLEESQATPERLLATVRCLLADHRLRDIMGTQMHALDIPDAAARLAQEIITVSGFSGRANPE